MTTNIPTEDVVDLGPFRAMVMTIGTLPTAFTESMTYYEALAYFVSYLEKTIIPAINQNAEATKELQKLFVELKDYVDHYFATLNVQEEINNKLDAMAESGELVEIIAAYLNSQAVIGFDTISDMASSENLIVGSICKTLGKTTATTGDGSFYLVRETVEGDDPDGVNLVSLTNTDNLVAEIIPDFALNSAVSTINTSINGLDSRINALENPPADHYVIIGDSLGAGQNPDATTTTGWCALLRQYLNISPTNATIEAQGGAGFGNGGFNTLLTAAYNSITHPENVKYVILGGGANEYNQNWDAVISGIDTFMTNVTTYFPNAKIIIGYLAYDNNMNATSAGYRRRYNAYLRAYATVTDRNAIFLANVRDVLHHDEFVSSDGVHLNQNGYNALAKHFANLINGGNGNGIYYELQTSPTNYVAPNDITNHNFNSAVKTIITDKSVILMINGLTLTGTLPYYGNDTGYLIAAASTKLNGIAMPSPESGTINSRFPLPTVYVNGTTICSGCLKFGDNGAISVIPFITNAPNSISTIYIQNAVIEIPLSYC